MGGKEEKGATSYVNMRRYYGVRMVAVQYAGEGRRKDRSSLAANLGATESKR